MINRTIIICMSIIAALMICLDFAANLLHELHRASSNFSKGWDVTMTVWLFLTILAYLVSAD